MRRRATCARTGGPSPGSRSARSLLTIVVVAVVARVLVPDMPWAVAIALGAIVAPPDAAAATAVLKQLRPPHRLLVILEGESLFNDASALLVYRLAVGATLAGALSPASAHPDAARRHRGQRGARVRAVAVDAPLGAARMQRRRDRGRRSVLRRRSRCGCSPSGCTSPASSPWSCSRWRSPRAPADLIPARIRIPSYAVWEFAVFVLNVLAFILVGFQLKGILGRLDARTLVEYAGIAVAVCVATILARIAWVSGAAAFSRWRCRPAPTAREDRDGTSASRHGAAAVVGWCGMRGIVTLAAALALPTGGADGAGVSRTAT